MEACCRHLRDGAVKDEAGCAMVLVCDHLGCVGGPELMHRLCSDYLHALAQQRAQASHVRLLQLENSLPAAITAHRAVHALDCYTDPDGWLSEEAGGQQHQSSCCMSSDSLGPGSHPQRVALGAAGSLQTLLDCLTSAITPTPTTKSSSTSADYGHVPGAATAAVALPSKSQQPPPHSVCVVVDCLTPLLLRHSLPRVLRFLYSLREHPSVSCVLASLHKDAHSQHVVDGMQHAASCTVEIQPVGGLQAEVVARSLATAQQQQKQQQQQQQQQENKVGHAGKGGSSDAAGMVPHGCVEFQYEARRGGRMRCERAFYTITPSGGVCVFAPPPELSALMMPEALVGMLTRSSAAKAAAAQEKQLQQQQQQQELKMGEGKAGSGPQQPQLPSAGGMRMGLSKEEREARDAVVLPYEHQGQHGQYRTSDWRDYLPPSAGGWNPANAQHARHLAPARPSVPNPAAPANGNATAQFPGSVDGPETSAQQQQQQAGGGQVENEGTVGEALGRILYVRDSDDGAASDGGLLDSDEDPDDDLDI